MNFVNRELMMNRLAQSQETLRSGRLCAAGNFRSFVNPENKFIYDNGAHWESISFNNIKLQYDINNGLPLNIKKYYFYENLGKTESTIFPNEQLSNLDEVVNQIIKINQLK